MRIDSTNLPAVSRHAIHAAEQTQQSGEADFARILQQAKPPGHDAFEALNTAVRGDIPSAATGGDKSEVREAFDQFVGQTFYGQMLKSMRKTVGEPAYFHGGRAEEIFRSQLDQVLSEKMTEASASEFTGPMFELFSLPRR